MYTISVLIQHHLNFRFTLIIFHTFLSSKIKDSCFLFVDVNSIILNLDYLLLLFIHLSTVQQVLIIIVCLERSNYFIGIKYSNYFTLLSRFFNLSFSKAIFFNSKSYFITFCFDKLQTLNFP